VRNQELIRQWEILRALDSTPTGVTVQKLSRQRRVVERTIRRDLDALQEAGFPLYSDKVDGSTFWKIETRPFKRLTQTGLSLTEICALYMSRSMFEVFAATPMAQDLSRALEKIETTLPDGVRAFLNELPSVFQAKTSPAKRRDEKRMRDIIPRVMEACLQTRRAMMKYFSASSGRTKEYLVEPYRMAYAYGGLYLFAYVPEYGQMRTFAVERMQTFAVLDERFKPSRKLPSRPFPDAVGVFNGTPQRVGLHFDRRVANVVSERSWHPSQQTAMQPDGSVKLTLDVCIEDPALKRLILSFGPLVQVVAPIALAEEILEELEEAREKYVPRMDFEGPMMLYSDVRPPRLPFSRPS
jgi:predicted DNA-binding transcriptional regulator YafY